MVQRLDDLNVAYNRATQSRKDDSYATVVKLAEEAFGYRAKR